MKILLKKEAFSESGASAKAMLNGTIGRYYLSPRHTVSLRRVSGRVGERGTWRATVYVK